MKLKELWIEARKNKLNSLAALIELVVLDKKVHSWEEDSTVLDRYLLPQHEAKMNALLGEKIEGRNGQRLA